jgi:uncharacterized Zn-binding protein involved in type VI secretion
MSRIIIVLGDPTSHGGKVISGSPSQKINGKPIARLGDKVQCPIKGHGVNAIVEGDSSYLINGIPVALHGHKTECGCSLMGTASATHGGAGTQGAASFTQTALAINSRTASPHLLPLNRSSDSQAESLGEADCFGVVFVLTRNWQTTESTIGVFSIEGSDINGYMVEEKGPSTTRSGLQQRVPVGEYELVWHQGARFSKALRLRNALVPDARAILIHVGNTASDTEGCLLPGSGKASNAVTGSLAMTKKIYQHIEEKGYEGGSFKNGAKVKGGAKLIIAEEFIK